MREVISSGFTPQRKIIGVNNRYGNTGIRKMQGSTVCKWDTLPIDGRLDFRFFEGAQARQFPETNVDVDGGNRLNVGSSFVCERYYLTYYQHQDTLDYEVPTGIETLPNIQFGQISVTVANKEVIKNVPIMSSMPSYNKNASQQTYTNFEFDTQIVLQPLLEYVVTIRVPILPSTDYQFLRLTIEGTGAIISPSSPF